MKLFPAAESKNVLKNNNRLPVIELDCSYKAFDSADDKTPKLGLRDYNVIHLEKEMHQSVNA